MDVTEAPEFITMKGPGGAEIHVACPAPGESLPIVMKGMCMKCGASKPKNNIFSDAFSGDWMVPKEDKAKAERMEKIREYRAKLRGGREITY